MSENSKSELTLERIRTGLGERSFSVVESRDGLPTFVASVNDVFEILRTLHDACGFEINTLITATDHDTDAPEPRFEMTWQLQSVEHSDRVRLHCFLAGRGGAGDAPTAPSVMSIWPGAAYSERECFDMFGILFEGHEGLKRLLMPEAYEHFPLRKDFPHAGIEPDRLYKAWDKQRRQPTGGEA